MNVLIVTMDFVSNSANTICIKTVTNELVKRGHSCKILTPCGMAYDSGISNEYKDVRNPAFSSENKFVSRLRILFSYFSWPKMPFTSINKLFYLADKEIATKSYDVMLAYCNPFPPLLVCSELKNKYGSAIKYCAYFLDSIFDGPVPRIMSSKRHDYLALKNEHKVLTNADDIVMMKAAEPKYIRYKSKISYFDKIRFLDIPLYKYSKNFDYTDRVFFPKNEMVIFFAGSMPLNIRNPKMILELFCALKEKNVHLYLAGKSDYSSVIDFYTRKCPNIHYIGSMPHAEAQARMCEADILLNIGNSLTGMVPCKIFEYMSTGKPIISTYRIEKDPCNRYFDLYKNSIVLDERNSIENNMSILKDFLAIDHKYSPSECIPELYNNTPEAYIKHLEAVCS